MDPAALIALAVYSVPILFGIGAPTYVRLRNRARRSRLRRWLLSQGFVEDGDVLRGRFEDLHIEAGFVTPVQATLSVLIRPALDLGVSIQPARWIAPRDLHQVQTRDLDFENQCHAYGIETPRVRALLDRRLRQAILRAVGSSDGVRLTDDRVQLWISGKHLDGLSGQACLTAGAEVVRQVERLRHVVPVSQALGEFLPAWQSFAAQHDLELSRAPLGLRGGFRGRDVWAVAVRKGSTGHLLDVLAWFDPPLGFAIAVKPADWVGEIGVRLRDQVPAFAEAFEVEAADDLGRQLLAGGLDRELAKTQARHGATSLTSAWLWVRVAELPAQPDQALEAMEAVAELAHEIALRARQLRSTGHGPYRGHQ